MLSLTLYLRNLVWISYSKTIDLSVIFSTYLNLLKGLFMNKFIFTWKRTISILYFSLRTENSTVQTALLKVMNDILLKMNSQHVTLLVMLDLSAAFDTVNYKILLESLQHDIGIFGVRCNGLSHTCLIEVKGLQFRERYLGLSISIMAFPKVPASVHCSTSSMHQSCSTSLSDIFLTRTATLTILSYI